MNPIDEFLKFAHIIEARGNQLSADLIRELLNSHSTIVGKLAKVEADILTKPYQFLSQAKKIKALDLYKKQIEKVLRQVFKEQRVIINSAIEDAFTATGVKTVSIMNAANALSIPFSPKLNKSTLEAYFQTANIKGLLINDVIDKFEDSVKSKILSISRQNLIEGQSAGHLASRLKKEGIEGTTNAIRGMSRTLLQSAYNESHLAILEEQYSHIITGYKYFATLDRATCALCGGLDQTVFMPGWPMPRPPLHLNCRCTILPLTGTEHKTKRPAVKHMTDKDKAQVEKTTESYNQWLKRQLKEDPAFVRSILGKKRFELFSQGKISLQGMSTDTRIKRLSELPS